MSELLLSNFWSQDCSSQSLQNLGVQNCFQIVRTVFLNSHNFGVRTAPFKFFGVRNCSCQSSNFRCQNCSFQIFGLRTAPLNPLKFLISRLLPSIFGARSPFALLASEVSQICSFSCVLFRLLFWCSEKRFLFKFAVFCNFALLTLFWCFQNHGFQMCVQFHFSFSLGVSNLASSKKFVCAPLLRAFFTKLFKFGIVLS